MMKKRCLWYFRGYIKDHNHVRKLILSCKLFVFSSPLALFFSFSLLSVALSLFSHTCISLFPEICCSFYSGPWNSTPTIHKLSKAVKSLQEALPGELFLLHPFCIFFWVAVLKIHPSACEWQRLLFHPAQHPPVWPWPEPPQLTSRL